MKAICHIHTKYSFDGMMSPSKIVEYAKRRVINILLICDHDSFEGARQALDYAYSKKIDIYIPFSAEIKTEYGDIIVVLNDFDENLNISELKKFETLIHVVKNRDIERIAMKVDCIEVFNSRCSEQQNQKALNLCMQLNKVPIYGADAHLFSELDNVIVSYSNFDRNFPFLSSSVLLAGRQTQNYKIRISSLIKAVRKRNFYEIVNLTLSMIKWLLIEEIFANRRKNIGRK